MIRRQGLVQDRARTAHASHRPPRPEPDEVPLGFWACDPDGRGIALDHLWRAAAEPVAEAPPGRGWLEAVHPDDRDAAGQAFREARARRGSFRCEYRLRRPDGAWARVVDLAQPRFGGDGGFLGYVGAVLDVTERRATDAALRESEELFQHFMILTPQIPWIAGPDGMVIASSPRWTELTGQAGQVSLGTGWTAAVHPDDLDRSARAWRACLASGAPFDLEYRIRLTDGRFRWFRARATAWRDAAGRILRWYGTLEDIDDRKAAEGAVRESEALAHSVLESIPDAIGVLDLDGRLLFMNRAGYELLDRERGPESRQEPGQEAEGLALPGSGEELKAALAAARAGETSRFRVERRRRDGATQWLAVTIGPLAGAGGATAKLIAQIRDITLRKQAREAVEQSRLASEGAARQLAAVLESTTDSVLMLDHDWRLTYANRNAWRLLSERGMSLGQSLWEAFPEEADSIFGEQYRRVMTDQVAVSFEARLSGLGRWIEVHAYPAAEGISIFFRDVTGRHEAERERQDVEQRLSHLARHDALTGLPNRIFFREALERALAAPDATGEPAVLTLDIDNFALVNDTYGQAAGDLLLCRVAERLRECLGGAGMLARFGADEFAMICGPGRGPWRAIRLARQILRAMARPIDLGGYPVTATVSLGIAIAPPEGGAAEALIKAANVALITAKGERRGGYVIFRAGMQAALRARQIIRGALQQVLSRGELELHYQPLVRLRTGEVAGFEALLRWQHPERGLIPPGEFIPVAEESGLIVPMGEWALREACRQAAGWPEGIAVAVNLSPVQFKAPGLVEAVRIALTESGLRPERLQLEITESLPLQENSRNLEILRNLRRLGVRIAMDDFGTGHASLSYLRSFPFDKIKLDRCFVADLPNGQEAGAIVRAVSELGATLGITTTAEGVETEAQLRALFAQGYDEVQGYFLGRPVPVAGVAEAIRSCRAAMARLFPGSVGEAPGPP